MRKIKIDKAYLENVSVNGNKINEEDLLKIPIEYGNLEIMKELTRIEPEPEVTQELVDSKLQWMSMHKYNGLNPEDSDTLIRLLIHKVNELTDEVNRIKNNKIAKTQDD